MNLKKVLYLLGGIFVVGAAATMGCLFSGLITLARDFGILTLALDAFAAGVCSAVAVIKSKLFDQSVDSSESILKRVRERVRNIFRGLGRVKKNDSEDEERYAAQGGEEEPVNAGENYEEEVIAKIMAEFKYYKENWDSLTEEEKRHAYERYNAIFGDKAAYVYEDEAENSAPENTNNPRR